MPLAKIRTPSNNKIETIKIPSGVSKAVYQGMINMGLSMSDGQLRQATKARKQSIKNLENAFNNDAGGIKGLGVDGYNKYVKARDTFVKENINPTGDERGFIARFLSSSEPAITLEDATTRISQVKSAQGTENLVTAMSTNVYRDEQNNYSIAMKLQDREGLDNRDAFGRARSMDATEYAGMLTQDEYANMMDDLGF